MATHAQTPGRERAILFTLVAVQFTHILDFMIMMPLGSHLMRVFAISPAQFTYLVATYSIAAALTGLAGGFLLDRYDRRKALLFLYTGFGLATLGCALAPTYHTLLIARFAAGGFGGLAGAVVTAMVGDVIPHERIGRAMGLVMSAFPIASVLGVPIGLMLAEHFEWHAPFFLLAGLSVVILFVGARALPSLPAAHKVAQPWQQMREIVSHSLHRRGFLMSAALVYAGGLVIPFLAPTMVANVGLAESDLWKIYAAGGACTFFSMPVIGRLCDRYNKLSVLGWLSLAASIVVLILTNLPPAPLLVAMLMTALFMVTMSGRFTPAMAMLTAAVDSRYRGGFMSVNSAVQQAAGSLANVTAGLLVSVGPGGRLLGYPKVGFATVTFFGLTYLLARRLCRHAPHAAIPRSSGGPAFAPAK
ncbi:MAG: MFS transporter [Opitutus sp.]|nr:MFS transporter [Opitutus sp.]